MKDKATNSKNLKSSNIPKSSGKRLWDKGESLDEEVQKFSVGNDPELDMELLPYDIIASIAHTQMLHKIGILEKQDSNNLVDTLRSLKQLYDQGDFSIPIELEDGHTAIETYLVENLGAAGLRVHTGRSRNDQVLVATRLYLRKNIVTQLGMVANCIEAINKRCEIAKGIPMPGYTHLQPAMPSSVRMWLHAFTENFLELFRDGFHLLERINSNPLGVASGFGVPLPLDRGHTAELLGFDRIQRNPIDVQNSRGRYELKYTRWAVDIAGAVEKFAWDMQLYSMQEFGFFSLPGGLRTGSSIMPQKKNPDVLELLRGRAAKVRATEFELTMVLSKLPSHYHRDLQYTKEPLLKSVAQLDEILPILTRVVSSFEINEDKLREGMTDDLYATYDVYRAVKNNVPFREAYRETGRKIDEGSFMRSDLEKDFDIIQESVDREFETAKGELVEHTTMLSSWKQKLEAVELKLLGQAKS